MALGNKWAEGLRAKVAAGLLLLLLAVAAVGQESVPHFQGRLVADVIDQFRADNHPFAYSTALITAEMTVQDEPQGATAVEIVRQILKPYHLEIRAEEGLYLIVRSPVAELGTGSLQLVVRDRRDFSPVADATFSSVPVLDGGSDLAPGIRQYADVDAASYRIDVNVDGFETATRVVRVMPGETSYLSVELQPAAPMIETVTVSASRYQLSRDMSNSLYFFDQRTIQTLPDLGEDALRATHRLPGAAAGGISARSHFRGGEESETGVILNGLELFDPFHIRDYQNIFSTIDARAIEGVEVYTGGFPARYGDRLSGLVLMESLDMTRPRHTELGVSVFNTSLLTAGVAVDGDTEWIFSARRGNLDLVLNPDLGEPSYYDLFGEVSFSPTPDSRVSVNGLYADDRVLVILESDIEELEQAESDTQNSQFWVTLDNAWSEALKSTTVLSVSSFTNLRTGITNDIEKTVSSVDDRRDITQLAVQQDWTWLLSEAHLLQWGVNATHSEADYRYMGSAEFFGLPALYEGVQEGVERNLSAAPDGDSYAVYLSDKWRVRPTTIIELGVRWDHQTYTDLADDSQVSPRISLLQGLGPATELRLSWGRYHQSQGIHELQIEDGIDTFFPAQRADHAILGLRHQLGDKHSLRVELFEKQMSDLRPRFENLFNPLALIPELTADRVRLDLDSAQARGIEVSVDRQGGPLNWWANYTYSEVTDRIDGRDELRSWDQTHALQMGLNWSKDSWDMGAVVSVHTGWPITELSLVQDGFDEDGEPEFIAIPGPRNSTRASGFGSLDLRISRKFDVRRGTLTAFFEVSNATDHENVCCLDYDLEEDEDGNEILERSSDFWLPLLPAIGVLWEF